jgi:hypothetical protein
LAKRALGAPQVATFHTIHNNVAPNKSLGILLQLRGSSFLHTLAIYLLLESKIAGLFVLEEKARGICANSEQIPDKSMFAFAGYL